MKTEFVFVDENPAVVAALAQSFGKQYSPQVRFVVGNVFCQGPGILPRRMNLWVFDTFERRLEAQVAQTTGKRYAVDRG
jgi:hypothetical protein